MGKSVVITGGSRGLGVALAKNLIRQGAQVTILARDQEELNRAEIMLKFENLTFNIGQVLTIKCDVTNPEELSQAFTQVEAKFNKIDILINNAGSIVAGPFDSMEMEDFEAQMNLHVYTVIRAVKMIKPHFIKNGSGHIVNISSIGGKIPVPHMSTYTASKFALAGLSESIMSELASDNIKVTAVYPGLMRTGSPIQAVFKGDYEKEYGIFAAGDMTPIMSVSAEYAAQTILQGVKRGDTQVVVSLVAKAAKFTHDNFPETFNAIMKLANEFLPKSDLKVRKTGAQSQRWSSEKLWFLPFKMAARHLEQDLNQKEKYDAEFNLNLKEDSKP